MTTRETQVCDCPEPSACYTEGHAAGKGKAYLEIEETALLAGNSPVVMDCGPFVERNK